MGTKYFTLLTQVGEKKLAAAIAAGKALELAQMGVGDGNGVLPTPDPLQTKLVNEKRRGVINSLTVDPDNTNQMIAEQVIPENEGGFWLREIGLYDVDGDLIALGNCPETYKPELKEGSGRVQTVRMILIVSRTDAITLKFDPTVALATRRYADTLLADHVVAVNPHKQYAPIESPAFTGTPAAPTAVAGTRTTQLATTAFVVNEINSEFTEYHLDGVFSAIDIAKKRRIMQGKGSGVFSNGTVIFTLPLAFSDAYFSFIAIDVGNGAISFAATPAGAGTVTIYARHVVNGALINGTFDFKYIAMGGI
ncbi:tail protein [Dickeya zeae EC1]|nr:tail protein [Dickeya zeae EC1]